MTDNDWIKQLQSMMERHQEPAPDGLWDDIESRLPERPERRQPSSVWRRLAAAAAAVVAIAGTGYLLWPSPDAAVTSSPGITMTPSEMNAQAPEALAQDAATMSVAASPSPAPRVAPVPTVKKSPAKADVHSHEERADNGDTLPRQENASQQQQEKPLADQPSQPAAPPASPQHGNDYHERAGARNSATPPAVKVRPKRRSVSLGFYASNAIKAATSSGEYDLYSDWPQNHESTDPPTHGDSISLPYYEGLSAAHQMPLSLGVSVSVPLTDRLALTSGVTYTRLKSTISRSEQTLHYLGVPVGVTYSLWRAHRFSVYATAGMQADFNIKATLRPTKQAPSHDITKDRIQFSALLGPGLQLSLTRDVGIYCEPTVRYYFDNGSQVLNYFKDKPWNININAGLRFTLQ